jgi:hypothetical protein
MSQNHPFKLVNEGIDLQKPPDMLGFNLYTFSVQHLHIFTHTKNSFSQLQSGTNC